MKVLFLVCCLAVVSSAAFAEEPTIGSLLDRARILRRSGKPQEAKPLAEKALTRLPSKRLGRRWLMREVSCPSKNDWRKL